MLGHFATANPLPLEKTQLRQKVAWTLLCFLLLGVIGYIDYVISYRISLIVFYALPIGLATLYVGPSLALLLAVCAIVISRGGDMLTGMPYPGDAVFLWNATVPFAFFVVLIALLTLLNRVLLGLQSTVEQRNRALLQEMRERGRLEREVIELSEREHRRFGQELHNLVSQELAGIAIDMHLLAKNLATASAGGAENAREIALKVDRALTKARNIARGFFATGFDAGGLKEALREIADRVVKANRIACAVSSPDDLVINNEDATVQLFRIAQEAVQNAVQHAGASRIDIQLDRDGDTVQLAVEDNGKGLPHDVPKGNGLGLSIMAYRAGLIGGKLKLDCPIAGGTRVVCRIPAGTLTRRGIATQPSLL